MAKLKRVYPHTFEVARDRGELEIYHKNTQLNRECATAIDKAVSASNYELYRYDIKGAVQKVCDEFGPKRVAFVLASVIQHADYDGRYSRENKTWAQSMPATPEQHYVCNTHPTILDDVAKRVRTLPVKQRKPSVVGQLQESKKVAAQDKEPAKSTPKRDNGMEV